MCDFSEAYTELQGTLAETREALELGSLDRTRLLKQLERLNEIADDRQQSAPSFVRRIRAALAEKP